MAIQVGLLVITLDIRDAVNLKDKRRILRRMIDRVRNEMRVSIAEVGLQNRIRSSTIAATFVGTSRASLESARRAAEDIILADPRVDPIEVSWEWL